MWPDLANIGFVSGRAATEDDVREGNAAFVLSADGRAIGRPISVDIPQYALHVDEETGEKTPCILIQAEAGGDQQLAGARYLDGQIGAGFLREFQLLGTQQPPASG